MNYRLDLVCLILNPWSLTFCLRISRVYLCLSWIVGSKLSQRLHLHFGPPQKVHTPQDKLTICLFCLKSPLSGTVRCDCYICFLFQSIWWSVRATLNHCWGSCFVTWCCMFSCGMKMLFSLTKFLGFCKAIQDMERFVVSHPCCL